MAAPASNAHSIESLNEQRVELKQQVDRLRKEIADIETAILEHPELPALKNSGTTDIGTFKIQTGATRNWDQAALTALYQEITGDKTHIALWPFTTEWKEVNAKTKALALTDSELLQEIEDAALELKPKKPYFTEKKTD